MDDLDKPNIDEVIESMPSYAHFSFAQFESAGVDPETEAPIAKRIVVVLSVSKKGFGFGEFRFITDDKGQLYIDTEHSDRETVKAFLCALVDGAIVDWDKDPEKHRRFNENCGVIACNCGCGYERGT